MDTSKHIKIFDTTLRDGQQCPGAGMSFEENLEYARLASSAGIDVIEAGFPSASKLDYKIARAIVEEQVASGGVSVIAALCQLRDEQVDITLESLEPGIKPKKARFHTYVPVSPELMKASLGSFADNKPGIVDKLAGFVRRAVDAGVEVEFSPEGYSRMGENFDFVTDLIFAAVESGASVINCPDTIGGGCKFQGDEYFVSKMSEHARLVDEKFPGNAVTWSGHCHNDFGLALDNSINCVLSGPARQIEGCINGVGERAGNLSLEQFVLVIKHFVTDGPSGVYTGIDTEKLGDLSDFVAKYMLVRQPHTPICGDNAARHSSGGHTNAILKNPLVYQPFDPGEVGKKVSLVFGPLSGGNHAKSIIEDQGYICGDDEKADIAQYIKSEYSERRKGVTDSELFSAYRKYRSPIITESINYSRHENHCEVELKGEFFDESGTMKASHDGPDSSLAALKVAIDRKFPGFEITNYESRSEGQTVFALSVATITISNGDLEFQGEGQDSDIPIAIMKGLISAINNAYIDKNYRLNA